MRKVYARECGAEADASIFGDGSQVRPWLDTLDVMSARCRDNTSFLPLAGRDVWRRHADGAIMCNESGVAGERVKVCEGLAASESRACILYLCSNAAAQSSAAIVAFLDAHPAERLLLVSSSNYDNCMPDTVQGGSLLLHSGLTAWFTENACVLHPRVIPLPIGPKFATITQFGIENVRPVREKYLGAMRRAAIDAAAGKGRSGLMVKLSDGTSEWANYLPTRGIRRIHHPHMTLVAQELDALEGLNGAVLLPQTPALYLEELAARRLCWSPPGAGLDAHRTWESLIVGTPPVVLKSPLSPLHAALPVVEVSDFGNITAASLLAAVEQVERNFPVVIAEQRRPVPQVFAFWWLARIEETARGAFVGARNVKATAG